MKVIGISGKAEAGKTTFATILREQLELQGKRTLLINYADYVKFIAKQYYFWNGEKDEGGRALLQHIGTEQGRNRVSENIWVDMVINTIDVVKNDYDVAIVADCRFPNEYDRWREKDRSIYKVRIIRPGHESKLTKEQLQHSSETSLDNYNQWDMIVINAGTEEDLKEEANEIIKVILTE